MSDQLKIEVFSMQGDEPFICAVYGKCTTYDLAEIELEMKSMLEDFVNDGDYEISCNYFKGQYGEYGRCELPPGWELSITGFTPISDDTEVREAS